VAFSKLY